MDKFKISATGHPVSYFPLYVSQRKGFFAKQGLDVEWRVPDLWETVIDDIDAGLSQAALGGIWNPAIYNQLDINQYRAFANLCSRACFTCVSRQEPGLFDWKWFEGKKLLIPCYGGISAYVWTAGCLKEHGVDLDTIEFITEFGDASMTKFFFHGMGDVLFTGYIEAQEYVRQGKAHICLDMLSQGGPTPWSVLYAPLEAIEKNKDLYRRFAMGLKEGLLWMQEHDGESCRRMLAAEYPDYDTDLCVKAVDAYREHHNWSPRVAVDEEANYHYALYQVDCGLITKPLPLGDLVHIDTTSYADDNFSI